MNSHPKIDPSSADVAPLGGSGPVGGLKRWLSGAGLLFWLCVVVPTTLAIVYFGVLASDVYISESRFVVRSPKKPSVSGVGMLLETAGFSNGSDEMRAAQGYISSREALRALDGDGLARRAWGNDSIFILNRFDPFGLDGSFEELFLYYDDKVAVDFDSETGIATMMVRAFTPQDAQVMNRRLLERAEALVNQLNDRSRGDGPQGGDAKREQHGFNEQPEEADIVAAIAGEHFPQEQRAQNAQLDPGGTHQRGVGSRHRG